MNPFAQRFTSATGSWVWPVSMMALVVGVMISAAWVTGDARTQRLRSLGDQDIQSRVGNGTIDLQDRYLKLQTEISKLRSEKTKLENVMATSDSASKALNDSLQEAKTFAGLTPVTGEGVIVTLKDSTRPVLSERDKVDVLIHDMDVLRFVNELWAAGAEAIQVGDYRVSPRTCIRCVGSTIRVDEGMITSPIVIKAIGKADTLYGAMWTPGGVTQGMDNSQIQIDKKKRIEIVAYSGSTGFKVAKVDQAK